ncbi:Urocanate hydratase, partial [Bienertia sinuspersici]
MRSLSCTRKRKSKKVVNALTLEKNTLAVKQEKDAENASAEAEKAKKEGEAIRND